ncbi:TetR/AcrR family transcriptional regulator [Agrobacterium sp. OT33]|uniref:TetR/AcrR family transcriptional regulator n=1 Tax=Agrobacterium sp. OT33 TaxID=2815338 RepID=UPI001A8FFA49|nr:TetR/AcrR family transcriptional regulator [Agrobacterium sp. OT33]MBO0128468.1 TetR/AcrR family transcriptional regulator [Agrobacterium sp. OT33]
MTEEQRRSAVTKAAHEAFVELGFGKTTTAVIAAKAKVSKRAIYEFFSDRTELFAAVICEHRHLILDLPRPDGEELPVLDALVKIFRLDIDDEAELGREAILNLIVRESVQFPELSDYLYENEILRSREELVDWLQGQERNNRMIVEDPLICAGMLMDIVFGALLPRRRLKHRPDRAHRTVEIKKRLEIFLRGTQTT